MNKLLYILIGITFLIYIYSRVRKKRFSEKESIIWAATAIVVLVLSLFPKLLDKFAIFIGVSHGPSLLFLMSLFFLVILFLRKEEQITQINEKIKELAQRNAILEEELYKKSAK